MGSLVQLAHQRGLGEDNSWVWQDLPFSWTLFCILGASLLLFFLGVGRLGKELWIRKSNEKNRKGFHRHPICCLSGCLVCPLVSLASGVLLFDALWMANSHLLGEADHYQESENFFSSLLSFFLQQSIGLCLYKSWHGHEGQQKHTCFCINVHSFVLSQH